MPERLFSTPTEEAHGVSAVKALAVAAQQGQKIYTVTASNVNTVLPQLHIDANIKTEIRDAVAAGNTATVHQAELDYYGWHGTGYIISDNEVGTGAYKISGGADGGWKAVAGWAVVFGFMAPVTAVGLVFMFISILSAVILISAEAELETRLNYGALYLDIIEGILATLAYFSVLPIAGGLLLILGLVAALLSVLSMVVASTDGRLSGEAREFLYA